MGDIPTGFFTFVAAIVVGAVGVVFALIHAFLKVLLKERYEQARIWQPILLFTFLLAGVLAVLAFVLAFTIGGYAKEEPWHWAIGVAIALLLTLWRERKRTPTFTWRIAPVIVLGCLVFLVLLGLSF